MSDWRIAKLRQLCDVATPGPWEWKDGALRSSTTGDAVLWPDNVVGGAKTVGQLMGACGKHAEEHAEVNATIIALASPDVLKALFTMLDGARAEGYAEAKEQAAQTLEAKQHTCELLARQWRDAVDVANRNAQEALALERKVDEWKAAASEATVARAGAFGRAKAAAEAVIRRHAERGRWYLEDVVNDVRTMKDEA